MQKLVEHAGEAHVTLGVTLAALTLLTMVGCTAWPWAKELALPWSPSPTPTLRPTWTPEPLLPTSTALSLTDTNATATASKATRAGTPPATPLATTSSPVATDLPAVSEIATRDPTTPGVRAANTPATPTTPSAGVPVPQGRARFGVGVVAGSIRDYPVEAAGLDIGWYLDWSVREHPARPGGADFWQMVNLSAEGYRPGPAVIRAAAAANPGSFWVIGNEPDVRWQDNVTPERYAELYHELHDILKQTDPTCLVVIGGVSQPTPLRLAYLDRVLAAYQQRYGATLPVDVWNVHGFILREERDSWGVDIPPGMPVDAGMLYEIDDHDDLVIFRRQLLDFRRWMADHGQRDKPLVVSEYGILMPSDYGFDAEAVQTFLEGSLDILLTATDQHVGYPRDGNRLVQWWCWYSLAAPDDYYPTGNLFNPATKTLTPLGMAYAAYSPPQ